MKQSKKFEYKRIIVLTEDYMTELQSVIQKYSRIDSIRGKTKNDTEISFDSFEQLLSYVNFGEERLVNLDITGRSSYEEPWVRIDIEFQPHRVFRSSVICNYEFENEEQLRAFEHDINGLLSRTVEKNSNRIAFRIALITAIVVITMAAFVFMLKIQTQALTYTLSAFLGVFLAFGCSLSSRITGMVYPYVTFAWGEGKKRYEKSAKLKANIFWCVVIAVIIAFSTGIILNVVL